LTTELVADDERLRRRGHGGGDDEERDRPGRSQQRRHGCANGRPAERRDPSRRRTQ
jgi:hypothetical protein